MDKIRFLEENVFTEIILKDQVAQVLKILKSGDKYWRNTRLFYRIRKKADKSNYNIIEFIAAKKI